MKKNHVLSVLMVIVMLSGILSACAPAAPKVTSKVLNLFAFSEYVPEDLISGFEKETGAKINYETYSTNEEMLTTLAEKPGKYDIVIPSDYAVQELIDRKALLTLDLSVIPNYDNIDTAFLSPYFDPGGATSGRRPAMRNEKFSMPYLWGTTGIVYDQTKITKPITSWEDLWRPELAGHIVVLDDAREMLGLALLTLGYDKNETNPARLAEARDKLKELAPGIVAYDAETPQDYLLSGQAWVGVVYNGNAALAERENPDLVYVLPSEGAGIWFDNMVVPADAPHPDASLAFINYVLRPESGALMVRDFPYSTPNISALDYLKVNNSVVYDAYVNSLASNPPQDALLGAHLIKKVNASTARLFEEYWISVKSTR